MSTTWRPRLGALVCVLLLAACAPEGEGAGEPAVDLHTFGTPRQIGTGLLTGTTPDGSAAYVEEPDPRFPEPGCEGQPEPAMFRLPLDGGERTLVGNGAAPLHGRLIRGGREGRVAVVAACESFFQGLVVARESGNGAFADVTPVTPQVPEGWILNPGSMSWAAGGRALLASLQDVDAPDGDPPQVVSIDPGSGELTRVFDAEQGTGVLKVGQMRDGTYVVAANLVVWLRDGQGVSQAGFEGHGFEISPDLRRLAIYGKNLQVVEQGSAQATELLEELPGRRFSAGGFSPDSQAIVVTRYSEEGDHYEVGIVTLEDRRFTSVVIGDQYGRSWFAGDGRSLVFNHFGSEPDFVSDVYRVGFESG